MKHHPVYFFYLKEYKYWIYQRKPPSSATRGGKRNLQNDNSWFPDIFRPMIHDSFIESLHDLWFI